MSIGMHPTLQLSRAAVKSGVGEAVGMTICLPVDGVERGPLHPRQLCLDRDPQLPKPRVARGEDATHLLDDQRAVTLDAQVRDTVVCSSPGAEQQRGVLGRVVGAAAARHVVGASPHYGAAGLEQRSAGAARSRVGPAGTVEAQQPLAGLVFSVFLVVAVTCLGLLYLGELWREETVGNP